MVWSAGLVQKINNFHTLSLRDFTATNLDPFLSIYDDYFYHTQTPRRPEVALSCVVLPQFVVLGGFSQSVLSPCEGRGRAGPVLLCRAEQ